jgi:hypothetical protein
MSATASAASSSRSAAARSVFWAAVWLAVVLVALKAFYLGAPQAPAVPVDKGYLRSLAAISYRDVLFAMLVWLCGRGLVRLVGDRPLLARIVSVVVVAASALAGLYAILNILMFGTFGGFLTYPLLLLIGNVRMLSSSVAAYVTWRNVLGLVGFPLGYVALVWTSLRLSRRGAGVERRGWFGSGLALAGLVGWVIFGRYTYSNDWATRTERRVAENPHWVLASSWWQAVSGCARGTSPNACPGAAGARQGTATAAERDSHRARIGGGAVDEPQRAVRHDPGPRGRVGSWPGLRQRLRTDRPQLELSGRDTPLHLPEAQLS